MNPGSPGLRQQDRTRVEMVPEEEVKAMVGARRFERIGRRKDDRDGTFLRRVLMSTGQIDVSVSRSRAQGSPVDVLGYYRRRADWIDDMIAEACVGGVSQRKTADVTWALNLWARPRNASPEVLSRWATELPEATRYSRGGHSRDPVLCLL